MGFLYHFSHFFEVLIAAYFGGTTLLAVFDDKIKESDAFISFSYIRNYNKARIFTDDAYKILLQRQLNIILSSFNFKWLLHFLLFLLSFLFWFIYLAIIKIVNTASSIIHKNVYSPVLDGNLKKIYLPSYYFAGIYCFCLITFGAYIQCNDSSENTICINHINKFVILLTTLSLFFYAWSLFLFPRFVNVFKYPTFIFIKFIFIISIFALAFYLSGDSIYFISWFLIKSNYHILILYVMLVSLLPVLYMVFGFAILVFTSGISLISNYIYNNFIKVNTIENVVDIDDLNNKMRNLR